MFKPQDPFQILEILVSIKDDNPIEENKTYLVLHCGVGKQCGQGLCVRSRCPLRGPPGPLNPSAEGSEGSKIEWEAKQVQVYSALRI